VAGGYEGKVAIVWAAHWPSTPGGSESENPESIALLVEQNQNDIFCMISMDGGASWETIGDGSAPLKHNCSQVDSTVGGYVTLGDVGALIDNTGTLHIVYCARPTGPLEPGRTGASALDWVWPNFPIGSRVLHWSDTYMNDPDELLYTSVIKDYQYDLGPDGLDLDSVCLGGAWHSMALNWSHITQCDDKLYTLWGQFGNLEIYDPDNPSATEGWDDCDVRNFTQLDATGSSNAQLFFSVSTVANGGLNWDGYHRLTTYVGRCDSVDGTLSSGPYCHSHSWPSVARFGMLVDPVEDDFGAGEIVQDGSWSYTQSPNWYFDVLYVDDRHPGGVIQGEGGWSRSPLRWFRVPCIDPDETPQLTLEPSSIVLPTWYKPGGSGNDELVTMINSGNSDLTVSNITLDEEEGPVSGWLAVDKTTTVIDEVVPTNFDILTVTINDNGIIDTEAPALLKGTVTILWDGGQTTDFTINCIIADTVQLVKYDTLFTPSISVAVNNAGRMGAQILNDTISYMGFHPSLDCDNCYQGPNNNSGAYIGGASPFILHEQGTDTIVSAYVSGHSWLSKHSVSGRRDGFRPQGGIIDLGVNGAFASISSNIFYSADSTVGLEVIYHAPQGGETAGPGSPLESIGNFINQEIKVFNVSGSKLFGVYVGDIVDVEVPADSSANTQFGASNFSDFDEALDVMYAYGWETALPDTFCDGEAAGYPNDCADASKRYAGSVFLGGFRSYKLIDIPESPSLLDYQADPRGVLSEKYQVLFPRGMGDLNYDSLLHHYPLDAGWSGYEKYTSADPDSAAMDLVILTLYGQYDIGIYDTLYFHKQLLVEYQVETVKNADFLASVAVAKDYSKSKSGHCCRVWGVVGDADVNGVFDILDLIWMIDNKFKGQPGVLWPDPDNGYECTAIMDFDANGIYDILDIIWGIDFKFKESGLPPVCPL
jgi:hypothetical protein